MDTLEHHSKGLLLRENFLKDEVTRQIVEVKYSKKLPRESLAFETSELHF
jgi:hypothetical protein